MIIEYQSTAFAEASLTLIEHANGILHELDDSGYTVTLRQLYYRFVAKNIIENNQRSYKRLGNLMSNARLAGLIDWDFITDRTRVPTHPTTWETPDEILEAAINSYTTDHWKGQPHRPQVWIEKDALIDIVAQACEPLQVPYFSCRGYCSMSALHEAAERIADIECAGQEVTILYLGDHDPSGLDMASDLQDRLSLFNCQAMVDPIALTRAQIDKYDPPPNFAKISDSRAPGYIAAHGPNSWELDALEPAVLTKLIQDAICALIDNDILDASITAESHDADRLRALADRLADDTPED